MDIFEPGRDNVKPRDVWVCIAGIALAVLAIAVIVIHGGSPQAVAKGIGLVIPFLAVCLLALGASPFLAGTSRSAIPWFWGVIAVEVIANVILPYTVHIPGYGGTSHAFLGKLLLLLHPTGIDFLDGVYNPARAFSSSAINYPPLTLIIGKPFTLLDFSSAYIVHAVILVALGVASAALSASLAGRAACRSNWGDSTRVTRTQVAMLMTAWLVTSYGFMFEIERGNIDLYALVFSLLAVWLVTRERDHVWLSALLLAIAINIKVYPAILLVLLFWRYRWRALVPVLLSNAVLLLVVGPANALSFIRNLAAFQGQPYLWVGNQSAASFAQILRDSGVSFPGMSSAILLLPLCLWAFTMLVLFREGFSNSGAVWAAAASVPLMGIVPTVSHDYKLVLLVLPMALIVVVVSSMRRVPFSRWIALLTFAGIELAMLARSPLVSAPQIMANKYPLLVLVQLTVLALLYVCRDQIRLDQSAPALAHQPATH